MSLQEIIEKEDGKYIHCYKQGVFWVCYEQSAYVMFQHKGYKPTKKMVKAVGQEVVSLGFPDAAKTQWEGQAYTTVTCVTKEDAYCAYSLRNPVPDQDYQAWKAALPTKQVEAKKPIPAQQCVCTAIKEFPIAHKTPVEAFVLIKELQELMAKGNN